MIKKILLILSLCFFPFHTWSGEALYGEKGEAPPVIENEDEPFNFGFEADFVSKYVWRGLELSEGPVLQPNMWFSSHGATLSVWGNFVLNDEPNQGQLNEIDFNLGYGYQYKRLIIQSQLLFYLFPHQDVANTAEGAILLGVELGPFKLLTAHIFDWIDSPGAYFGIAGGSFEKEFHPKFSLKTVLGYGWANTEYNETYFEVPQAASNLLVWTLDLNWYVLSPMYLRPHMKVSVLLDEQLRDSVEHPTLISGGLGIGLEF